MAFPDRPLAENASRNERSDWDAFSGSAFKRKLYPGIELQSGTCFPVRSSSGNYVPDSSLGMGRAFRMGFKRKLCPRIDMASSGKRVLEYRAGVFGGCGGQGGIAYARDDGVAVIPMAALGA